MTNINITVNGFVGDEKQLSKELGKIIRETMKDDVQVFKELFAKMGHTVHSQPIIINGKKFLHGDMPEETESTISVSQAIFCFDENGRYLGVVADKGGWFKKREIADDYSDLDQEEDA